MIASGRLLGICFILVSTLGEALGQFAFKRAANHRPVLAGGAVYGPFTAIRVNFRWIVLGFAGFIVDGILWSAALHFLDLTVAHPIGSIVFVVVAIISKVMLREQLPPRRWIGIGFVLAGATIVAFN